MCALNVAVKVETVFEHTELCVDMRYNQCCGCMKFWYGSGSAVPYLRLMDPDPAIFVSDLQEVNKKLFLSYSAYYFLKVHLHYFLKIKSRKEVAKQ